MAPAPEFIHFRNVDMCITHFAPPTFLPRRVI